jgi:outer membrane protein assembly factor BamD
MTRNDMRIRTFLCLSLLLAGCATTEPITKDAETYFREGEEFYAKKAYEDAIAQWKKVKESYSSPELTAKAELKIADAQFDNSSYIEAAASYEDFRKLHPAHEKAAYALYRQGLCHYHQIAGIDTDQTPVKNAVGIFENFLRQYPASEYAAEVKEKLEVCRMKQLQYEIYVGRFYLRSEKYQAAIKRLEEALAKYPKSPIHDETLFYLGKAYILSGEKAKGEEVFSRLSSEYGSSKYVGEAGSFIKKHR